MNLTVNNGTLKLAVAGLAFSIPAAWAWAAQ